MLDEEQADLEKKNAELIDANEDLGKENDELKRKIALTIQRIDINNLLKEIDKEELQVLAVGNKERNRAMEELLVKWDFIKNQGIMWRI